MVLYMAVVVPLLIAFRSFHKLLAVDIMAIIGVLTFRCVRHIEET